MHFMKSPSLQHFLRSDSSSKFSRLLISSVLPFLLFLQYQNRKRHGSLGLGTGIRRVTSVVEVPEFDGDMVDDGIKATEKHNALSVALTELLSADFCKESKLDFSRFFRKRPTSVVSTGSLKLDLALGIGGLPKGRMVEIYGSEASGKTTLGLQVIKEAQKLGGYCAYLDVENAMNTSLAESMGVNTENLLIARPDSAENLLCMVDTLTKSGSLDVIVVDSVAALVPQSEIDLRIGDIRRDFQSQIMTKALRKIQSSLCRSETLIIFINQVRFNPTPGKMEEVTSGGNALRFYAAIRLKISRRRLLKAEDEATGLTVCVQVVKNKLAPAMKKAELDIQFGKGFSRASDAFDLACEHGVITDQEGSYEIRGEVFSTKEEAIQYLSENEAILDKLVTIVRRVVLKKEDMIAISNTSSI